MPAEMNYDALDAERPAGEVLLRGPGLFSGYFKQEDKTAEVMDEDGFFHTGDIGVLTEAGALKIVDRKKNIFKLSQVGRPDRGGCVCFVGLLCVLRCG